MAWKDEMEKEWDKRADYWHERSQEMWETGSRKDIIPLLKKYLKSGAKICDLGCGDGYASYQFAKQGYDVTGVDVSENMLEKANKFTGELSLAFKREDVSSLSFKNETFDAVMAINSLEWTENPLNALLELKRIVKTNGYLCIAILGPTSMPRMGSYRRFHGEKGICNTIMPWEFEKLAEENNLFKIEELGVMKRGIENLPLESLSRELRQALSFLWVFIYKKHRE